MISPYSLLVDQPEITPEEYFFQHETQFLSATAQANSIDHCFKLGPFPIKFNFANSKLVSRITPAYQHLAIAPPARPDLTVHFWDSASTGVGLKPPPWNQVQGAFIGFEGDGYFHKYNSASGCMYSYDTHRKKGYFWINNYQNVPYFETGIPIIFILNWWLKETSFQLVHGGAVGFTEGGVLLIGKGGSGKSTTCASALKSNLFYAGDDYCLVDTGGDKKVYSLFNSAKIRPDMLSNFEHLKPVLYNGDRIPAEKPLFFLFPQFKERLIKEFPIKAIFIPQVTHQAKTWLEPVSASDAIKALAPNTIFQLSGVGKEILQKTTRLVQSLPCYFLKLGNRPQEVPGEIERFLQDQLS